MTSCSNVVALSTSAGPPGIQAPGAAVKPVLFPESALNAVTLALAPMRVTYSDEYAIRADGTEDEARAAALLMGHGLPGDVGCAPRQFTFKAADGRNVSVIRYASRGEVAISVHVKKTASERRALQDLSQEVRKRKQLEVLERERARESPTAYREMIMIGVGIARIQIRNGNATAVPDGVATCRLNAEDVTTAIELVDRLEQLVANAKIVRCGPLVQPVLGLVR